jgi:uncharacterized protein (DUF433 family)
METAAYTHIESRPEVRGGKPCIKGTRISVYDVHVWHNLRGETPEEIVADFPQLSVSSIYAALSYYLDHREQIEDRETADQAYAEKLEQSQGPTRYTTLRDRLLEPKHRHDDSIPSG